MGAGIGLRLLSGLLEGRQPKELGQFVGSRQVCFASAKNIFLLNVHMYCYLIFQSICIIILSLCHRREFINMINVSFPFCFSLFFFKMVKMQRIPGPKEPAELTYYTLYNGKPLLGTTAAKILSTVDSQRMALTLGYVVQVQADRKNPFLCLPLSFI